MGGAVGGAMSRATEDPGAATLEDLIVQVMTSPWLHPFPLSSTILQTPETTRTSNRIAYKCEKSG